MHPEILRIERNYADLVSGYHLFRHWSRAVSRVQERKRVHVVPEFEQDPNGLYQGPSYRLIRRPIRRLTRRRIRRLIDLLTLVSPPNEIN